MEETALEPGNYNYSTIEKKWQKKWLAEEAFACDHKSSKPKYYVLDMFPYPSGNGLHVGHIEGYTATDIIARFKRMKGYNVHHPMGWDAFGLPAEQYAIKTATHPQVTTEQNIKNFKRQIQEIGFSTDWKKEVNTTDPNYYKWTQWIFLKLYEKGLAYESFEPVNWCPALGTVLANEEVINGRSEVGDFPVIKKPIRQWVLKITDYAEKLLEDLDELDWPESTKEMQRNWIGKSVGVDIQFQIEGRKDFFTCFSTRVDTLWGATFCVLAPEHPLVKTITTKDQKDQVEDYLLETLEKSEVNRTMADREKTGVFTGAYAINPANGEKVPVYIADYVLMSYGSGAIMAVPGHDERDHAFAKKYDLPIKRVISQGEEDKDIKEEAYTGEGFLINSGFLDKLDSKEAVKKMTKWLEDKNLGKKKTSYRLRDWIFSRQRYWGEPFPLLRDQDGKVVPVEEKDLPVTLPNIDEYKPSEAGDPPLSRAKDWVETMLHGKKYERETNIMPQWAGSCWYYLRYLDPDNSKSFCDSEKERYWMPVDLYVGGVEHANLHLLYARFWHKVLYDLGHVSTKEPFKKVVHPGLVLGSNGEKMSKSRGNVVNPDHIIKDWGADSLRLFEMFLGPIDQVKPWKTDNISGVHRFLKRLWRLITDEKGGLSSHIGTQEESKEFLGALHKTIEKVGKDTQEMKFNTAVAAMMELVNQAYKEPTITKESAEKIVLLTAPYAPHICEELWEKLGHSQMIAHESWPTFDASYFQEDKVTIAIMVNGKKRGLLTLSKQASQQEALQLAKEDPGVKKHLDNQKLIKEIFVPGRAINFVVKP